MLAYVVLDYNGSENQTSANILLSLVTVERILMLREKTAEIKVLKQ